MQSTKQHIGPRIGVAASLAALLAVPTSVAGSPPSGAFTQELRFVDEGDSLSLATTVFGLDRKRDAYVQLRTTAALELACYNPAGKKVASQTPDEQTLDLDGFAYYPRFAIKFGRLDVYIETDESGDEIPGAPDCPNRNWTEKIEGVRFLATQLTVRQGNSVKLNLLCTFDPPTKDGKVPDHRVDCISL